VVGALIGPPDPTFPITVRLSSSRPAISCLPCSGKGTELKLVASWLYELSMTNMYKRAAALVDKIVKGAKPADLPVEFPTRFHFIINLNTAKALGLTMPPALLVRAEEVIE
jgi:ABC transporter substrate binding protein